MSETHANPFVPGARVAVKRGYSDDYAEEFIDKVYKTGRFTLRGNPKQQWRPSRWRGFGDDETKMIWEAYPTGDRHSYSRTNLKIWDASTDAEISEAIATTMRCRRFEVVRERIHRMRSADVRIDWDHVVALLRKAAGSGRRKAAWAKRAGVTVAYVDMVLAHARLPGPKILDALKLEKALLWRRRARP